MIVEDNCIVAQDLAAFISSLGFDVCAVCHTTEQALRAVEHTKPDLILMDIELDGAFAGVELAQNLLSETNAAVIYLSGHSSHEILMRAGDSRADGFILKPYDPRQLAISLHMGLSRRSREMDAGPQVIAPQGALMPQGARHEFSSIIGSSAVIKTLLEAVSLVAPTDVGVLISGENGTGKELIAEAIHKLSARSNGAFVAINCSAIPAPLLESALFGHTRGAFTGASRDQEGFLERAEGGTLFLDEIGDISQEIQVKLLRLLQSQHYHRVGETALRRADVRIVTATNRDLKGLVASGKIREDFFYRINVFPIVVPPLRERGDDVCEIANHFRAI
ncbi:MAG: sigma-54-dependent Fis family transcriptional regulator, partial [Proteobacteria bacterium]|nr:sigma-54-dependent Fis family transcriptional regulator [Pseudomonadota bacterium]